MSHDTIPMTTPTTPRGLTRQRWIALIAATVALLSLAAGRDACAEETTSAAAQTVDVAAHAARVGVTMDPGSLRELRPGAYQFTANGRVFHMLGPYLVTGPVIDLDREQPENITLVREQEIRREALAEIAPDTTVVFPPKAKGKTAPKARLVVFTDPTCAFCQRFHQEVPALNDAGVEIVYLPFPRAGDDSPAAKALEAAWCATDQRKALTQVLADATNLEGIRRKKGTCTFADVLRHAKDMARRVGVAGTPAVFTLAGQQLGGYRTAADFLKHLGIAQ
jgi:thiol:disulfide interchange protein DsbC